MKCSQTFKYEPLYDKTNIVGLRPAWIQISLTYKAIIFAAAMASGIFNYGFVATMGGLYIGMLDTFNAGRAQTAFVQSLTAAFALSFGVVAGFLIKRFGIKVVSFTGAMMPAVGFLVSFFSTSIYLLYGFVSVISGIGFNIMYVSAVVSVGQTFNGEQKSIMVSLQSVGSAISGFIWPHLFTALLNAYGLRGTLMVLSGLFFHNFAFAIILRNCKTYEDNLKVDNIKQHTYKNKINNANSNSITSEDNSDNVSITNRRSKQLGNDEQVNAYDNRTIINMLRSDFKDEVMPNVNTDANECPDQVCRYNNNEASLTVCEEPALGQRETNLTNHNKILTANDVMDQDNNVDEPGSEHRYRCLGPILILYLTFTLASTLHVSMFEATLTLYQDINVSRALTLHQSDLTFMSFSLLNILSRFLPIIPARCKRISIFTVPILASLCGALGQVILLTTTSFTTTVVAMGVSAVSAGGWMSSSQAILFQILPLEKQALGFGIVLTAVGIASSITGPIFGSIRDNAASYSPVMISTASIYMISAFLQLLCLVQYSWYQQKTGNAHKQTRVGKSLPKQTLCGKKIR